MKYKAHARLSAIAGFLLAAAVISISSGESARSDENFLSGDSLQSQLDISLTSLDKVGVLGSVLSITMPGKETITASHGFVDIERSIAMDPGRLFQIGSQTKMFTAAALLLLQNEGKLHLDDLVSKYVPGVPRPDTLTIRQLAMHQGGIGDSVTFFDPPAGRRPDFELSFENHLLLARVAGEQFEPGTDWSYNNFGFIVLGKIIEAASGLALNEYTRKNILEPMEMQETYLGYLDAYPYDRMARGFFDDGGTMTDTTQPGLSWASSAGDMISSINDMAKWSVILVSDNNPLGLSLEDFSSDAVPVSDFGNLSAYGLGMMQRDLAGQVLWGHGGFIHGYVTLTLVDPETEIVLQLMTSLDAESDKIIAAVESVAAIAYSLAAASL